MTRPASRTVEIDDPDSVSSQSTEMTEGGEKIPLGPPGAVVHEWLVMHAASDQPEIALFGRIELQVGSVANYVSKHTTNDEAKSSNDMMRCAVDD